MRATHSDKKRFGDSVKIPSTRRRWQVDITVGYFTIQDEFTLGTYRWRWLADLAARWHLAQYPYRSAYIHPTARST